MGVQAFSTTKEAIDAANSHAMLQSYLFGSDVENALKLGLELECGSVMVNAVGFGFEEITTTDGTSQEQTCTFFKAAGLGTESGGAATVHFFAGAQSIGVNG